jgi:hypothetical protein
MTTENPQNRPGHPVTPAHPVNPPHDRFSGRAGHLDLDEMFTVWRRRPGELILRLLVVADELDTRGCPPGVAPGEVIRQVLSTEYNPLTGARHPLPEPLLEVNVISHQVPMATGRRCTCGRDVAYNLAAGLIVHTSDNTPCRGDLEAKP